MGRRFLVRHGADVLQLNRKLLANSFLFDVGTLCFSSIGNCLRIVSCSVWGWCDSSEQETICEWFPVRHGDIVLHLNRKLFADSFLSGVGPMCAISTGNCSTGDFSTPLRCARNDSGTWRRYESYRWETTCERFPVRHGNIVFQFNRKLLANGFLSDVGLV